MLLPYIHIVLPQPLPSRLPLQTLLGPPAAQDAHEARVPPGGQVQHRPRCVCVCGVGVSLGLHSCFTSISPTLSLGRPAVGLCPNALHKRRLDSLRYLMYARFVEVSLVLASSSHRKGAFTTIFLFLIICSFSKWALNIFCLLGEPILNLLYKRHISVLH